MSNEDNAKKCENRDRSCVISYSRKLYSIRFHWTRPAFVVTSTSHRVSGT